MNATGCAISLSCVNLCGVGDTCRSRNDVRSVTGHTAAETCLEVHYPHATQVHLILDNLNTHTGSSLYETFAPEEARRLLDRLAFHYTPKHASWLNMAEIEISVLNRQCLHRRIDNARAMCQEIAAWEAKRNAAGIKLHGTFTIAVARAKLRKLYPSIED